MFERPGPDAVDGWERRRNAHVRDARAARVSSPRTVISHVGAALVQGVDVLQVPGQPCLTVQSGTALRRVARAHLHRATLTRTDVVRVGDDLVTAPARTVMDISREFGRDAGVVAGDSSLHLGLVDERTLTHAYERCDRWPGRRRAHSVLMSVDGRSESPLESLSRLRVADHGLPAAWPQTYIYDLDGRLLGRCDLYWDEVGVVGECDGDLKYRRAVNALREPEEEIEYERQRQKVFEQAGLIVVRWGWRDLGSFASTARRLRDAAVRGARVGSPLRRWTARQSEARPSAA
ncbi:hypothetical protein GCM10027265_03170 [Jatrophihabitans fulvus]